MMGYRKDIDGLRSMAVLPVILAHAGFSWIPGGFLGVDVFFVISGYLITNLLLRELSETGRVKLGNFYLRRARRILPALFLVMAVTALFSWFILLPEELSRFGESIIWTTLFSSNIFFSLETDYFAPDASLSPLLHTWSLAVEEQFYLIFPLLLMVLWKLGAHARWTIPSTLLVIIIGSLILAQYGNLILGSSWSYYSLATRAWELLAGSLAAVWVSLRGQPRPRLFLSAIGFLGIVTSYFIFNETVIHPGILTAIPVLSVLLLILFTGADSVIYKILASPPMVFIGLISYSAYLWHQPLFALYRTYNFLPPSSFELFVLVVTTLIVASISWRWVEYPFRTPPSKTSSIKRSFFGFSSFALVAVAIGIVFSNPSLASGRTSISGVSFQEVESKVTRNQGLSRECESFTKQNPKCQSGDFPTILLWGDSYAMHLSGALLAIEPEVSFAQSTYSACAPILGIAYSQDGTFGQTQKECISHNEATFNQLLTSTEIQTIIISSNWGVLLSPGRYLNSEAEVQSEEDIQLKLRTQLSSISEAGKKAVLVGPPPIGGYAPSSCLLRRELAGLSLGTCNFSPEENRSIAREKKLLTYQNYANVLLLSPLMCSSGECITHDEGNYLYGFTGHLSPEGSTWLGQLQEFRNGLN
jgi:peptidoglycan/LPS O-acetylase OafA/YrhL